MNDFSDDEYLTSSDVVSMRADSDVEILDSSSDVSLDDDADSNFGTINPIKAQRKAYEVDFQVLTPHDLKLRQDGDVSYVADLTNIEPQLASVLLRHYGWNREKLIERFMENSDKCLADAGVDSGKNSEKHSRQKKRVRGFLCEVCFDEDSSNDTFALSCNHRYCRDCYETYLSRKINAEGESRRIQCMRHKCNIVIDENTIASLVDPHTLEKYHLLLCRTYVDDDPRLRWCPAPNCDNAIQCAVSSRSLASIVPTVECSCGTRFCFGCGLADHQPCICALVKRWLKKCEDDSETANWISAHTKECPKCQATIEKNGGCNHMTCKKCRHEFCWVCMGLWSSHNSQFYNCSRYDESKVNNEQQSKSRASLERYLFYYNRYANHEQSSKLEKDLYMRMEKKMEEIQASSNLSWIEVQFMKRAVDTLSSCRVTLKWSYAMTYFLKRDNATFIFEDNQNDLEQKVEALSELLERPLEEETISELRQDITNRTVYVAKRHQVLLEDTARGHADDRWSYNIDVMQ